MLTDPGSSITEWFTGFRSGGLSITGGIIGGALGVVLFCIIHKINFLRVADCLLPGVILAQAMGRWGNFFNQEVYGGLVTDPSMQWFPFAVYIENRGEWHYAFFFYEMLANLVIFALLFTLMWKFNKRPHGLSMCGYFFGYGLVRSIMEPLRDPQFQLGHTVMISEVFAIIMCVGGFLLAVILIGWNKYKHGSFFGSKNSEPLAVMPVYYTKDRLKKMAEENKLTEARILQAGGAPALPKEEKPLTARHVEGQRRAHGDRRGSPARTGCGERVCTSRGGRAEGEEELFRARAGLADGAEGVGEGVLPSLFPRGRGGQRTARREYGARRGRGERRTVRAGTGRERPRRRGGGVTWRGTRRAARRRRRT